jgi:hypothetical protein
LSASRSSGTPQSTMKTSMPRPRKYSTALFPVSGRGCSSCSRGCGRRRAAARSGQARRDTARAPRGTRARRRPSACGRRWPGRRRSGCRCARGGPTGRPRAGHARRTRRSSDACGRCVVTIRRAQLDFGLGLALAAGSASRRPAFGGRLTLRGLLAISPGPSRSGSPAARAG